VAGYPAGWRGWIRGFWNYDLRFHAWEPGMIQNSQTEVPKSVALTPEQIKMFQPELLAPQDRAIVLVSLIARKGA
jgi:hypothetical protein